MNLRQFNALKQEDQLGLVYNNGVYINDRFEREFTIVLYEVEGVCVELYYHEAEPEPTGLKSFEGGKQFKSSLRDSSGKFLVA